MDAGKLNRAVLVCLLIFLISLYLITISTAFTSRNGGEGFMKINEMESFLRTGQIGFGNSSSKWGAVGAGGKKYNWHQFGQQAFVLPLYLFMRVEGYAYYFVNIASTALTAVIIMQILLLLGFRLRPSALTALTYGTATLAWHYASKTPHEHALAIALIMGGIYFGMKYQTGLGRRNLYFCIVSIGLAFTVRYDAIVSVLPLAVYFFLGRKDASEDKFSLPKTALVSAILFAPFLLANFTYNYIRFETFFSAGYSGLAGSAPLFAIEYIPRGIMGALFSPGRSIFLFSPVLFLFPFYVREFKRRTDRLSFTFLLTITAAYFLFYCYYVFGGDWCFGPRFYLPILPFLVMPLVVLFEGFKNTNVLKKTVIVIVIVFSIFTQIVFTTSNAYLSNVIKFGISDDSLPELTRKYTRHFGEQGSWEAIWKGYFPIKHSQFFNQFKLFRYTVLINLDRKNINVVADEIRKSHSPYLLVYFKILEDFDVWWLQQRSTVPDTVAIFLAAVGAAALFGMFKFIGMAKGTEDT